MAITKTLAGLAAGAMLMTTTAFAQGYPERQITMVVPFSAGGPTDTVGRLIAEAIFGRTDTSRLDAVAAEVRGLLDAHPLYPEL